MKRLRAAALAILTGLLPLGVLAADFRAGDDQLRVSDEVIEQNLYAAGGNVTIDSAVNGDAFVAGGQIDVDGVIQDDLFVGGGNIRIVGDVQGDVRIGGGNVRIEGNIGGELLVGGGTVEIAKDASVAGDVLIGTGQLIIDGATGSVTAEAGDVSVGETAKINGDLRYTSPNEARIDEGAVISGETSHKLPPKPPKKAATPIIGALAGTSMLLLIGGLITLLLFVYLMPAKSKALAESWRSSFGMNLLIGFVFLVVTPIAGFALLVSVIGIPLGIGVFLLYPVVLFLGKLVGIIAAGAWMRSFVDKGSESHVDWLSAILGFVILTLIGFIPGIGALIGAFVMFAGLGAFVRHEWNFIQTLRSKNEL